MTLARMGRSHGEGEHATVPATGAASRWPKVAIRVKACGGPRTIGEYGSKI
jgi:hypothetical protein